MPDNQWLNRQTKRSVQFMSPGAMARQYGGSFVDVQGNAASNTEWVFNPDLSAVDGFAPKYWDVAAFPDDTVSLKSQAERDLVDANELDAIRDTIVADFDKLENYGRALVLVLLDEINALRAQHGLAPRTPAQARTAIRNKLGT